MKKIDNTLLEKIALSVRMLSADATREANSGHPGLPLGLAELGALLFAEVMKYNPADVAWATRDRLVLSAGHGSMWLYSLLHMSGYKLPLKELKKFRQLHSKTPGHPEYGHTPGVETTTGPLGAGFSNAVGMAIAERMLREKFGAPRIHNYTYVVSGDGCMMEGLTSEAASLAGHLALGNLIVFYDSNKISIEGPTDLAFTEDVGKRFAAYNWQVLKADAHNFDSLRVAIDAAQKEDSKPTIIICKSTIGKGAPTMQGTAATHGAPLPPDEIAAMKRNFKVDDKAFFYIDPDAKAFFQKKQEELGAQYKAWHNAFASWSKSKKNAEMWNAYFTYKTAGIAWPRYKVGESIATRKANGACIDAISKAAEWFTGGSADLEPSNNTKMPARGSFFVQSPKGRMLHYGVREHAMGGIVNGITLYGGLKAFGATFLVFSDYMRPAIRLASIMRIPSLFIFTHDSVFVGEDGPTHQPVEQAPSLRLIPNLRVFRPADAEESVLAWQIALAAKRDPSALLFTRQNCTVLEKPKTWKNDAKKGAYVVCKVGKGDEIVLVATGSEVEPTLEAAKTLSKTYKVRVVSMLCKECFDAQTTTWKETIVPKNARVVIVEAATPTGWDTLRPIGHVGINGFGACGSAKDVKKFYGLNSESIAENIKNIIARIA